MQIAQTCELSSISCGTLIFLSVYAIVILIVPVFTIVKIIQTHKLTFELFPMTCCAMQALLHLVQFLFYNHNKIQIATAYLQVITFTYISSSFAKLHYQLSSEKTKCAYTQLLIFESIFYIVFLIGQLISFIKTAPDTCNNYYYLSMLLLLIQLSMTSLIATYYGRKLVKVIKQSCPLLTIKHKTVPASGSLIIRQSNLEPSQIRERRKQIHFVLILLIGTTLSYAIFLPLVAIFMKDIVCDHDEALLWWQDVAFAVFSIVQMTPCLLVPYVFYYIPKVQQMDMFEDVDSVVFNSSNGGYVDSVQPHDSFVNNMLHS